jgi:hypothetical protein
MKKITAVLFTAMMAFSAMAYDAVIVYDGEGNKLGVSSSGSLSTVLENENGNALGVDTSTRALIGIDYEHHEIHSGSHYYVSGFNTLDDGDTSIVGLMTADTTKSVHLTFSIEGTGETQYRIYEGSTYTGGVSAIPFNSDRNSTNVSGIVAVIAPTVLTNGLLIASQSAGKNSTVPSRASLTANSTRANEIILKRNTDYTIQITSVGDDNIVSFEVPWYEHTPKTD